jgi:hypothetical protein
MKAGYVQTPVPTLERKVYKLAKRLLRLLSRNLPT